MAHYSSLYDYVVTVIADIIEIEVETFNNDTHIYNDLHIDSFQALQILQVFEEDFDIVINQQDFQHVNYVSDIVDVLEELGADIEMVNTDSSGENGNGESGDDDISIISEDNVDESSRQASYTDVVPYTNLFAANSRLLTYKDLLDTAKRYSKHYIGNAATLEALCPWQKEKFITAPATFTTGIRYWSNVLTDFTVLSIDASVFKEFNSGSNYTHLLSFSRTITLAMRPTLSFPVIVNPISDEDEGTDYGVSPASMDFDDEGSESGNIDDTGITYSGRSSSSGGASTFALEAVLVCGNADRLQTCATESRNCITITTTTLPGKLDIVNPEIGVCETSFCGADFTSNCAIVETNNCGCGDCSDNVTFVKDTCNGCTTTATYTISFCATAFIKGTNIGLASCSATMYTTTPKNDNVFGTLYMKIPKYTYFTLTSKPTTSFGISIDVSVGSTSVYTDQSYSVTGTINAGEIGYLFNSNDKTMKTNIAQNIFSGGYLKSN
jgi:acyl carrier protein